MDQRSPAETELRRQVGALFHPLAVVATGAAPCVGFELELFVLEDGPARSTSIPIDRIRSALASDPGLVDAATVTFEPGGQLELSPAPRSSVAALIADGDVLLRRVREALARDGLAIETGGIDRWRTTDQLGLQVAKDRYLVMQRHFDSIGPAGRRMMRQTAALQVCVDLLPGRAGRRQWVAANVVGPALAAAFRNPAGPDNRTRIWQEVDRSRTGFDGAQLDCDRPADAYAAFALGAEAMPLERASDSAALPFRQSFGAWASENGDRPDEADVAHHLTTLFPPVRPRRYLEVRYLDAPSIERLAEAVILVSVLLADEEARESSIDVAGDITGVEDAWHRSAVDGLADPHLVRIASDLIEIAVRRCRTVSRQWPGWLPVDATTTLECLAEAVDATRLGARP